MKDWAIAVAISIMVLAISSLPAFAQNKKNSFDSETSLNIEVKTLIDIGDQPSALNKLLEAKQNTSSFSKNSFMTRITFLDLLASVQNFLLLDKSCEETANEIVKSCKANRETNRTESSIFLGRALRYLAILNRRNGNLERSLTCCREANSSLDECSESNLLFLEKANLNMACSYVYFDLGNYAESEKTLNLAIEQLKNIPAASVSNELRLELVRALINVGVLCRNLSSYELAEENFAHAKKIIDNFQFKNKSNLQGILSLKEGDNFRSCGENSKAIESYKLALKNFDCAVKQGQLISGNFEQLSAMLHLSELQSDTEHDLAYTNNSNAISVCEKMASTQTSIIPLINLNLGILYYQKGLLLSNTKEADESKYAFLQALQNYEKANSISSEISELRVRTIIAKSYLAISEAKRQDLEVVRFENNLAEFDKILSKFPDSLSVNTGYLKILSLYTEVLQKIGKFESATQLLNNALAKTNERIVKSKKSAVGLYTKAQILRMLGSSARNSRTQIAFNERAIETFANSIELYPNFQLALSSISLVKKNTENLKKAGEFNTVVIPK